MVIHAERRELVIVAVERLQSGIIGKVKRGELIVTTVEILKICQCAQAESRERTIRNTKVRNTGASRQASDA